MRAARIIITAHSLTWARHAASKLTGFATSVIQCKCEAGVDRGAGSEGDAGRTARLERAAS